MTVKFQGRSDGARVMRLINEDINDSIDIFGKDDQEIWGSDLYFQLTAANYRFNASWVYRSPLVGAGSDRGPETVVPLSVD